MIETGSITFQETPKDRIEHINESKGNILESLYYKIKCDEEIVCVEYFQQIRSEEDLLPRKPFEYLFKIIR